jgi:NADH:ubiquinone oxidoreductase subunit 5 (subunit L)/multisubunit Na+/H+ antiporter MnhA subunit
MELGIFIHIIVLLPLIGFMLSWIPHRHDEKKLALIVSTFVGMHLLVVVTLDFLWAISRFPTIRMDEIALYARGDYKFLITFYFDKITAMYLTVGGILTFMIVTYSRYYLHRERGYKRFFNTILFFYFGYTIVVLAGNFETLFMGWEVLGISSFLLIAFYRERFLPIKNAIKVFSIYRLGDIGILLAMWMSHFLWHENIEFAKLHNNELVSHHLTQHTAMGIFISLMLLLAACIKSAQMPFSSWLPRAMEGPTSSSAIFYGSLSVSMGAFLLLRLHPFWEHQLLIRLMIFGVGFITMLMATGISRVQSSVKSQIAYSSIAQIGIIFIEIALGLEKIALIHFAGNAFLRTYQLLVSPSIVSYLIKEQFYTYSEHHRSIESKFPNRIHHALYILCLKEWNLDSFIYELIWNPIKKLARRYRYIDHPLSIFLLTLLFFVGIYVYFNKSELQNPIIPYLPILFASIGCLLILKSFSEKRRVNYAWFLVTLGHLWTTLAIAVNDLVPLEQIAINLSGVLVSAVIGALVLIRIGKREKNTDLSMFYGHSYEYPRLDLVFLLACLGMTGFPITPMFLGEDLLFSHIHKNQVLLASIVSLSFIVDGLSIIRIYARIFMGPHIKTYHDIAFRSS